MKNTPRGSLWRVWDFHTHTPASYQWNGMRLRSSQGEAREQLLKQTIEAMREADSDVFVIMDYWTFDGFLALREYLQRNPDAIGGKTIFPGIELRVESSAQDQRLNVHCIFNPTLSNQRFKDFIADLKIHLRDRERSLSDDCFITWTRELGEDKLRHHSFDVERVKTDDEYALDAGYRTAEITRASLLRALENAGRDALMLMPWDTYGGLRELDWAKHYAEVRSLMRAADIFECKSVPCRDAFHGRRTGENEAFFENFWAAIERKPRLCVRGTDAHSLSRYGQFPNGLKTWIKADPTFTGLLHAIKEPFFRSYIGDNPPKRAFYTANGSLFMDRLRINRKANTLAGEKWFDGVDIELNPDLVAIIGNKGAGKSGLADVLALGGNSKAHNYFTFLNNKRFRNGNSQRAGSFEAILTWRNGDETKTSLDQGSRDTEPERIKYISQSYFEELCNEHVQGKSDRFGSEIRKVLFSNMDPAERLDFSTLDDYLKSKEDPALERISVARTRVKTINRRIAEFESLEAPQHVNELREKLGLLELALKDLDSQCPPLVEAPAQLADSPPTAESIKLKELSEQLSSLSDTITTNDLERRTLIERRNVVEPALQRLASFEQQAKALESDILQSLKAVGVSFDSLIKIETQAWVLTDMLNADLHRAQEIGTNSVEVRTQIAAIQSERNSIQGSLDAPTKAYEQYLIAKREWELARAAIVGDPSLTGTLSYYQAAIENIKKIPEQKKQLELERGGVTLEIHKELMAIAEARRSLFAPVDRIVHEFPSIKEDLKVAFQSSLFFDKAQFMENFFALVKRNTGGFRGEEEGPQRLDDLVRLTDFASGESVLKLMEKICESLTSNGQGSVLMPSQVMRTGKTTSQLYDLLFGLDDLEAKFSLSLAGTTISQMSPGQRGALLLIFYLLVDNDSSPLVLDQPEENLDNQTVYSMLVPIIQRAKDRRQIIMVTHNANLAICCDAEQIIHAGFNRVDQFALSYTCGAIESAEMNKLAIDVLEGTQPAFGNRRDKYTQVEFA